VKQDRIQFPDEHQRQVLPLRPAASSAVQPSWSPQTMRKTDWPPRSTKSTRKRSGTIHPFPGGSNEGFCPRGCFFFHLRPSGLICGQRVFRSVLDRRLHRRARWFNRVHHRRLDERSLYHRVRGGTQRRHGRSDHGPSKKPGVARRFDADGGERGRQEAKVAISPSEPAVSRKETEASALAIRELAAPPGRLHPVRPLAAKDGCG